MTILVEGERSFFINTPAIIINDLKDVASNWASSHIYANDAIKWVLAKYVEADQANSNGQMWALEDLRLKFPTVNNSPMNIDHHQHEIVGTWAASELLYPTEEQSSQFNPYVEVLGAFWRAYFPEVFQAVEEAFNTGMLSVSMECSGDSVTCSGTEVACGETFDYLGPFSDTYCSHIKERASHRQINNPHFLGGALIMPPNKPGWKSAHVTEMSDLTTNEDADQMMEKLEEQHPNGSEQQWRSMMNSIVYRATLRKFNKVS